MQPWTPKHTTILDRSSGPGQPADLVSICVTVFNYERYLARCLTSLAEQTHRPLELIVVDDRSDADRSLQSAERWLRKHADRFHRCVLLSHVRNQGPAAARNTAFAQSRGDYVFVIDADNEVYPRAIARLYDAAVSGMFDATYCQLECFGDERRLGFADVWSVEELHKRNYVDVMSLVSREAWSRLGGYSHIEEGWEDYDFWLKFARDGFEAGFVPETLCRYRVHGRSRTATDAHAAHEKLKRIIAMRHPQTCAESLAA